MERTEQIFFSEYLERLENLHRELSQAIQDLPPEALDWSPGPEMNSIVVLLVHTAGSLRYWIGDIALGEPSGRVREQEFHTRGLDGAALQASLDQVTSYIRENLSRLDLQALDRRLERQWEGRPVTIGWALLHALEHGYLHLGHIQLTRQLWEATN